MTTLNLDINYFEHIKTIRLVKILGEGTEIYPIKLWCHCAKMNPKNGKLSYSDSEIENILGWKGERGKLISSLIKVRFLDTIKIGRNGNVCQIYSIHGWKKREKHLSVFSIRAKKASIKRWEKYKDKKYVNKDIKKIVSHVRKFYKQKNYYFSNNDYSILENIHSQISEVNMILALWDVFISKDRVWKNSLGKVIKIPHNIKNFEKQFRFLMEDIRWKKIKEEYDKKESQKVLNVKVKNINK